MATTRPVKEGWLYKEGGAARNKWQLRWFVLRGDTLFYYQKKEDNNCLGSINLSLVEDVSKVGDHSGRGHCVAVVGVKASKKVYYLSADTSELLNEWFTAFKAVTGLHHSKPIVSSYCTAEVFINNSGIRINGDVNYQILSTLSARTPPERKSRDPLGWFCSRSVAVSTVLGLFSQYRWSPDRIYRSTGVLPNEPGVHPLVRIIFSRTDPPDPPPPSDPEPSAPSSSGTGLGDELLEGTDDELIELMKEFGIPLNLLQV